MAKKTYEQAVHAMQSGVAVEMNYNSGPTDPKHLRVGVNVAMVDHAGLVKLLIDKGVFTEAEYREAITNQMNIEVEMYEHRLQELMGKEVKLG